MDSAHLLITRQNVEQLRFRDPVFAGCDVTKSVIDKLPAEAPLHSLEDGEDDIATSTRNRHVGRRRVLQGGI